VALQSDDFSGFGVSRSGYLGGAAIPGADLSAICACSMPYAAEAAPTTASNTKKNTIRLKPDLTGRGEQGAAGWVRYALPNQY